MAVTWSNARHPERAWLFEPDILTPFQTISSQEFSGERKLMLAVLEDGVKVAIGSSPTRDEYVAEARVWVQEQNERIFGFDICCWAAGIDPEWLRAAVSKRIESKRRVPSRWVWKRRTEKRS